MAAEQDLLFTIEDGVASITLNRPQARNALTFSMYEGLASACEAASRDESVRVMVITGAGDKAFAAGTDISQFLSFSTAEDALAYEARIDRVLGTLESCRVPTIAAIAGACTGGGAAIAACCDLRIATQDLRFGFPIARTLGNCLSVASLARLSALIGPARVKDLIFTARLFGAEEAQGIGLISEVLPNAADLQARARALAHQIGSHAPLTLRATKEGLRRLSLQPDAAQGEDLILLCYLSEDFREGREAFLGKRAPQWKGR